MVFFRVQEKITTVRASGKGVCAFFGTIDALNALIFLYVSAACSASDIVGFFIFHSSTPLSGFI